MYWTQSADMFILKFIQSDIGKLAFSQRYSVSSSFHSPVFVPLFPSGPVYGKDFFDKAFTGLETKSKM